MLVRSNIYQARQYMRVCNMFERTNQIEDSLTQTVYPDNKENKDNKDNTKTNVLSHSFIEKFASLFRRRRSPHNTIDFDQKYL